MQKARLSRMLRRAKQGIRADVRPRRPPGRRFPRAFFNAGFYMQTYPDVADSGLDPYTHFLTRGRRQGRSPSAGWQMVERAVRLRAELSVRPLGDIVRLFPQSHRKSLWKPVFWERLRVVIHPSFYAAQLGKSLPLTVDEVFDHYLSRGAFDGLRPSCLFHPGWYLDQLERRSLPLPAAGVDPFLHWLTFGWNNNIVPTPLFDAVYYASYPDVKAWTKRGRGKRWLFVHFVEHGCYEAGRRPSGFVPRSTVNDPQAKDERSPLVLQQMLAPPPPDVTVDLRTSTPVEDAAIVLAGKVERLNSDYVQALVAKAAAIEPLILRPYGAREANMPPVKHDRRDLRDEGEAIRRHLPAAHFDTVVFLPHCRTAGSARVAGDMTRALKSIEADASLLVLTTELPDFERPEWFSEEAVVFDVSRYAARLTPDDRVRLLLDAVRGLTPRRIINVNSRLGWDLFTAFGRQLAAWSELGAYLFTWDLDERGNKGGYPITYFQWCLAHLAWIVFDNVTLRNELVERYALSTPLQQKLHVAYTPVDADHIDHSSLFEQRRSQKRILRAFWGGRFDRQKRFDLVIDVAQRMPELEICAWGKRVLGGLDIDLEALPPNIKLQGVFQNFDDLPVESCDFFLYTAEWDGLPTMLLEAGARGVPTVASMVGGVREVLTESTGFPVDDPLNADAYIHAIQQMLSDPAEVSRRAHTFRVHVQELCSERAYVGAIAAALGRRDEKDAGGTQTSNSAVQPALSYAANDGSA